MPKYSDNLNRVLANDLYFNIFEKKGVKYLKIRKTVDFKYVQNFPIQLNEAKYYWSSSDNLYKISLRFYGTGQYWWAIGLVNRKPTDSHWSIGDEVLVPTYPSALEGILL